MNSHIDVKDKVVVILGGGLVKENGKWRTTNFNELGDDFGVLGDRLRIIAGSYLYKNNPEIFIIASGSKGQFKDIPDAPTVSEIFKKELIELGVLKERIIKEDKGGSTYQQLQEIKKIIKENCLKKVIIISNEWHLPRVEAMIKYDSDLVKMLKEKKIEIKSAEKICLKYEPAKWQDIINIAYNSEEMINRIELEKRGVEQIKSSVYKF